MRLKMVIGLNCEVLLAPGIFSSEWTIPVMMLWGHGVSEVKFSIFVLKSSNFWVRSSGNEMRSHLDHPSGPTADFAFLRLIAFFHCSMLIGWYCISSTAGTLMVKNSIRGSHLLSWMWRCLSHLLVHSAANFSKSFGREASKVSCFMWVPTSICSILSTLTLFWSMQTILHVPLLWKSGCSFTNLTSVSKDRMELLSSITTTTSSWVLASVWIGLMVGFRKSSKILLGLFALFWTAFWVSWQINCCSNCLTWISKISQMMMALDCVGGSSVISVGDSA